MRLLTDIVHNFIRLNNIRDILSGCMEHEKASATRFMAGIAPSQTSATPMEITP